MSLDELIAIDTQNPGADYAAMTRYLQMKLVERGAQVKIVAGNVLGTWGTPRLLLNAHMDTVRAAEGWTTNPLEARRHAGKIFGLGACDTKCNIQAILDATQDGANDVAVLFSTDEECGPKTGASRLFNTATGRTLAKTLQGAVVMEPTENRVIARHPGYVQVELNFQGSGGHSSSQQASAAGLAVTALHRLQDQKGWSVNVATIAADSPGANVRASRCRATASVRAYQPADAVLKKTKTLMPQTATLKVVQAEGPLDNRRPFVASKNAVPYWTDAAVLHEAGINTVVYGGGSIKQAHKADEFIRIASLQKATEFLKKMMGGLKATQ